MHWFGSRSHTMRTVLLTDMPWCVSWFECLQFSIVRTVLLPAGTSCTPPLFHYRFFKWIAQIPIHRAQRGCPNKNLGKSTEIFFIHPTEEKVSMLMENYKFKIKTRNHQFTSIMYFCFVNHRLHKYHRAHGFESRFLPKFVRLSFRYSAWVTFITANCNS